jgi:hypothetical protein
VPAEIPAYAALRDELRDSIQHAVKLDRILAPLISVRPRQPSSSFHGRVDHSQPPWHAPVAHAHTDLHSLSRKLERELRQDLGLPQRARGGSDGNTVRALNAIGRLCEKADDFTVRMYIRELERWSGKASVALGIREFPRRLPRNPGQPEMPCPWCGNRTLRMHPLNQDGKGEVRCVNPGCRDEAGRRPAASLEYFGGEWGLRWQDGVIS